MKIVRIFTRSKDLLAVFYTNQEVVSIVKDAYFKVTLEDGKFFIFDKAKYRYEVCING